MATLIEQYELYGASVVKLAEGTIKLRHDQYNAVPESPHRHRARYAHQGRADSGVARHACHGGWKAQG